MVMNIKANWKHATLEYRIKQIDPSQDMSRSAVFYRGVLAAQSSDDWESVANKLHELKKEEGAPEFTSYQARIDEAALEMLEKVKADILEQLPLQVLQAQYLVQLILQKYFDKLSRDRLELISPVVDSDDNLDLPQMASIFTEMMLTDKECQELKEIRKILADWRKAR